MKSTRLRLLRSGSGLAAVAGLSLALVASPVRAGEPRELNIPAGPLDQALLALAAQTGQQLLYPPELARGRVAPALAGRYTPEAAVQRLLAGTDVIVTRAGPDVVVLRRRGTAATPPKAPDRPFVDEGAAGNGGAAELLGGAPVAAGPEVTVEALEVTGSHIRGGRATAPLLVLDRSELDRSGHATVAAALQALPQNFAGSASEGVVALGTDRTSLNNAYATGVNLRGLGADATLVLVNGRRMAGSGVKGDFADVSSLPTAAVDRIEVLMDGASALYGSDAVGGVVNIILKRRFEGVEARLLYGQATAGEPREVQAALTAGETWSTGHVVLSYEHQQRERLPLAARRITASADLRPFGGSDHRHEFAFPGNVLRRDPVTGANVPGWAIPSGQDGRSLRPQDFQAGLVNLAEPRAGADLLPEQTRHSLYASLRQGLGRTFELSADLRYGHRAFEAIGAAPTAVLTVNRSHPFFVSPVGAASHQIAYSFAGQLPNSRVSGEAESLGFSVGAELQLPGDWRAEGYAAAARETTRTRGRGLLNASALQEALGAIPDQPQTAFRAARDGFFNPFAGVPANAPGVLAFIGSGFSDTDTTDHVYTFNFKADGALFEGPAGPVRAAFGTQYRRERYVRNVLNFTSGFAPVDSLDPPASRSVWAAFGEVRAPLIDGRQRLELSVAGRYERYSDFGDTANPKAGLLWTPLEGLLLRASYGRSFRAPALREVHEAALYTPTLLPKEGARVLTLLLIGGNPDLEPERATTWTAGVEVRPPSLPGLRVSVDAFDVDFSRRIDQPARQSTTTALTDPALTRFVSLISPATNPADRERIAALLASPALNTGQGVFPPEAYGAIVDARYVNTASLRVSGIDVQAGYAADVGDHHLSAQVNAAYILRYEQQLTPTSPAIDRAGIANFPLKLRARAAFGWEHGPWGAQVALNYAGRYRDAAGVRIDDHLTTDLQLRFKASPGSGLEGLTAALTVRNLFDSRPPFYDSPAGVAYDPANGDPVGRFVSLQLTRAW